MKQDGSLQMREGEMSHPEWDIGGPPVKHHISHQIYRK